MAYTPDFTKAPAQILIDLINSANSASLVTALTPELVTFGAPVAQAGNANGDTNITMTAAAGSGYSGNVSLNYNRVPMSSIPGAKSTVYTQGSATKISDLIPEINATYGINLTADDYEDAALPVFPNQPHDSLPFTITAKSTSLVWEGSLTLTLDNNDVPLTSVITTLNLPGLVYTAPTA
jgi:hypothetical protein